MKLGVMQPYFFPYIGYFSLIAQTERWVVFDITQYTPRSWMNRNRVLHPAEGWQYVTVPLKNSSKSIRISEARVLDLPKCRERILGQLSHYRGKAPFYSQVMQLVGDSFQQDIGESLVKLNISSLESVCAYLNIPFNYIICSEAELGLPEQCPPGEWALEISLLLGARRYINPMGGRDLFDAEKFTARGVELLFLPPPELVYDCRPYEFIEYLSILDVLMWNPPEKVRKAVLLGSSPIGASSLPKTNI